MTSVALSAGLMVAADPARGTFEVLAATRDISAGATLDGSSVELVRVRMSGTSAPFLTARDEGGLPGLHATHDLVSGQLIQHGDVAAASPSADERLVFIPVKDVPPVMPGSQVDLLVITGDPSHPTVQPFALGVEVRAVSAAGLVVLVPSARAAAFVYAGSAMQLAAVIAEPGATQGAEVPVSTDQQAIDIAGAP